MPFLETPITGTGTTIGVAKTDVSSNALQTVASFTTSTPYLVASAFQVVLTGSTATDLTPYSTAYLAPDGSGNLQVWQLFLTNPASLPAPVQTGLISGAPSTSTTICGTSTGSRNILQPGTGFGILQYAVSPNTCGNGGGSVTVLINSSDSSSTPPTPVPVSETSFGYFYLSSGQLTGLLGVDPATGNLNFYAASSGVPSFSSPVAVATGVSGEDHIEISFNRSRQITNTVIFSLVTYTGSPAPASKLIHVDSSGTASTVYTVIGTVSIDLQVRDNTNLYFVDVVPGGGSTTYNVYKAPIAGGSAVQIASIAAAAGTSYSLVDSDGTSLVIKSTSAGSNTLYTLAVSGSSSQTPTQILQSSALAVSAGLDFASGDLFVDEIIGTTTSALVLKPTSSTPSTPLAGPLANTAFAYTWNSGVAQSSSWLAVSPLPGDGTNGGAQIKLVSIANLTQSTTVTCPSCGGGSYTIPASSNAGVAQLGASLALGEVTSPSTSAASLGMMLNLQTNQLATYAVSGSNVTIFY